VIELGVVETVEEMDRARPRRRQAHADLARELGVAARHQRRHLLVAHLDELDAVRRTVESTDEAVDAVARIAIVVLC
jgi:hypothetical protein